MFYFPVLYKHLTQGKLSLKIWLWSAQNSQIGLFKKWKWDILTTWKKIQIIYIYISIYIWQRLLFFRGKKLSVLTNWKFSTGKASMANSAVYCIEYFQVWHVPLVSVVVWKAEDIFFLESRSPGWRFSTWKERVRMSPLIIWCEGALFRICPADSVFLLLATFWVKGKVSMLMLCQNGSQHKHSAVIQDILPFKHRG